MKLFSNLSLLLGFCLIFQFSTVSAQEGNMYVPRPIRVSPGSAEIGIFLGVSYYTGDLNPGGHFNRFTRPAAGALYRVNFNPRFSAKVIGSFGSVAGDDAYAKNEANRNRNLSFRSNLMEVAMELEFNFLPFTIGAKSRTATITTPYIFLGGGVFHFNPQGYYQGKWYNLQPLGTEGEGTTFTEANPYSLTQFAIPFGAGLKINTAKRISVNIEWGLRRTFTDYIDDVSGKYVDPTLLANEKGPAAAALADKSLKQEPGGNTGRDRGNSYTKDWYSFAGVLITFKLKGNEGKCDIPH